ncbi:DUF4142 domain-containing protein [Sorangium sp. So ce1000]|uniref:DUF4142 domain-containing protein n=1 Tax=Sorangium sp. So ce1000 TaxID=3133325 RepID=UPI003F61FFC0
MMGNRSGRLMAIMFAGSFVLAGAGGCIGSEDDTDTDRDGTAGHEGTSSRGPDGRSHGQTGRDGARGAGARGGRVQAGGRQGGRGQPGHQGGERAGGQRTDSRQMCGEQAGYQGGRQGGRGQIGSQASMQGGGGQIGSQGSRQGGGGQIGSQEATQPGSSEELTTLISFIHQKEVELSEIAVEKAESPDVLRYAEQISEEHSQSGQVGEGSSRGSRIDMESCPSCRQLEESSDEASRALNEEKGAEFDTAFVWAEISFHRRALELLDAPLVANAENAKIRTRVKATRADVEHHLTEAEQLFCLLLREQQGGSEQRGAQQQVPQVGQQQRGQFGQMQPGQQQRTELGQQQRGQFGQMQPGQQQRTELGQQQRGQFGQMQPGQQQGSQLGQQQRGQFGQMQPGQQQGSQVGQQQRDQFGRLQTGQQQRSQQQGPQAYAQQGESQKSQ